MNLPIAMTMKNDREIALDDLDMKQAAQYARTSFKDRLPVWGCNGVSPTRDATEEEIAELRKLHSRQ